MLDKSNVLDEIKTDVKFIYKKTKLIITTIYIKKKKTKDTITKAVNNIINVEIFKILVKIINIKELKGIGNKKVKS